jgi:hypothetical protein
VKDDRIALSTESLASALVLRVCCFLGKALQGQVCRPFLSATASSWDAAPSPHLTALSVRFDLFTPTRRR